MSSICWLRHYFAEPYVEYVRWELRKRGLSKQEIRQHLAAHEHYEEPIMTANVPTRGCKDDWLAVLQEAHRYIVHYSTQSLS